MSATSTTTTTPTAPTVSSSTLVDGFNHVATITRDLDRLAAFYRDGFDVELQEFHGGPGRHGFLWLSPTCTLHAFEAPESFTGPYPDNQMMRRGRVDHLAVAARDEHALAEIRTRLLAAGATAGRVQLFEQEQVLSLHAVDPDGMELEVCCAPTGDVFGEGDYVIFVPPAA
jgi:catechol 2,3-dioxygenase-like lactoylglutathione lyase family enzyme